MKWQWQLHCTDTGLATAVTAPLTTAQATVLARVVDSVLTTALDTELATAMPLGFHVVNAV